ncbi:hypothetical protein CRG98_031824, partial [Punica granatum]
VEVNYTKVLVFVVNNESRVRQSNLIVELSWVPLVVGSRHSWRESHQSDKVYVVGPPDRAHSCHELLLDPLVSSICEDFHGHRQPARQVLLKDKLHKRQSPADGLTNQNWVRKKGGG